LSIELHRLGKEGVKPVCVSLYVISSSISLMLFVVLFCILNMCYLLQIQLNIWAGCLGMWVNPQITRDLKFSQRWKFISWSSVLTPC